MHQGLTFLQSPSKEKLGFGAQPPKALGLDIDSWEAVNAHAEAWQTVGNTVGPRSVTTIAMPESSEAPASVSQLSPGRLGSPPRPGHLRFRAWLPLAKGRASSALTTPQPTPDSQPVPAVQSALILTEEVDCSSGPYRVCRSNGWRAQLWVNPAGVGARPALNSDIHASRGLQVLFGWKPSL